VIRNESGLLFDALVRSVKTGVAELSNRTEISGLDFSELNTFWFRVENGVIHLSVSRSKMGGAQTVCSYTTVTDLHSEAQIEAKRIKLDVDDSDNLRMLDPSGKLLASKDEAIRFILAPLLRI